VNSIKLVATYSKSLFQNVNKSNSSASSAFEVSKITSTEQKTFVPSVYIIGEELSLIRSTLVSSKKLKDFFKNPTYAEQQKLDVILNIFPGLTVTMKSFLKVLTERGHLSLIPEISDEFTKILLKFKNSTIKTSNCEYFKRSKWISIITNIKKINIFKRYYFKCYIQSKIIRWNYY